MKKTLSIILSIVMLFSVTTVANISAYANDLYEYESNNTWDTANEMNFGDTIYGRLYSDIHYDNKDYNYPNRDCFIVNSTTEDTLFKVRLTITGMKDNNEINRFLFFGVGLSSHDEWEFSYSDDTNTTVTTNTILARSGDTVQIRLAHRYWSSGSWCDYKIEVIPCVVTPSSFTVATRNSTSLKLSWSKVSGATGYQIQRKSGDTYKKIANTSSTSVTVKDLSSATIYKFRVRAYKIVEGKKYYSSWKHLTTSTKPGKVSIKSPSTNSKHQIIVKWNKVTKANGYQVQYCKNSSCSNVIATKTVSGQSKTSYTGKNFTKGKKYYVRVRAYKTVDGTKHYGAWSSVKSIKCK